MTIPPRDPIFGSDLPSTGKKTREQLASEHPLPEGVTRNKACEPTRTLEDCAAMAFYFHCPKATESCVISWRENHYPRRLKPTGGKRFTEVRPGDIMTYDGKERTVLRVEIYR